MISRISICLALFLVLATYGYAQSGVPVIVKGKVLDQYTNKPINVAMMFTDKNGKKFKITPNIRISVALPSFQAQVNET